MKLASIRFDDMVTVPGGRMLGEDTFVDACESSFRAIDGWEIIETTPGRFSLKAAHMLKPFIVGGYGYGYFEPDPVVAAPPPEVIVAKGKKR